MLHLFKTLFFLCLFIPENFSLASSRTITLHDAEAEEKASNATIKIEGVQDLGRYFDREAYMRKNVQQLIDKEQDCENRQIYYNKASMAFQWLAGIGAGMTSIMGACGAAEYIDPKAANFLTTCLGVATGLFGWASVQCRKSADQYYQAGIQINKTLGVSPDTMIPTVNALFDKLDKMTLVPRAADGV